MKHRFFLTFIFISIYFFSNAQQIPNGNFEDWNNSNDPVGWNLVDVFGIYSAEETSDHIQGLKAVKLENQELFGGYLLPGIISLGIIDLANQRVSGGIPFAARPTGLSYFFKYLPQGSDTCFMATVLTKWNPSTNNADTIASTAYFTSEQYSDYTKVSVPYIFMSEEIPDTMNVIFLASSFTGSNGTTLFIDSVSVLYDVVVSPTLCFPAADTTFSGFSANWLDVPDADSYSIDVSENNDFSSFVAGYQDLDLGNVSAYNVNLNAGLYFYRVRVHYGTETSLNSNKIAVPMPVELIQTTDVTQNTFTANWQPANNATKYFVDVSEMSDFSSFVSGYENYDAGTLTSLIVNGLNLNTEYFYRVRTEYGTYLSQNSEIENVTTASSNITNVNFSKINVFSERNKITVSSKQNKIDKILFFDAQGRLLKSFFNISDNINFYTEKSGIYFVKIQTGNVVLNKKVIVVY